MAKVLYRQGTKATYLGLLERNPSALYFCTDTKELFKGDDLYSDGVRIVGTYAALPMFETAADGILYLCEDTGCGYVLNESRNGWIVAVHGVDNETISINENGLLFVKSVPMESVSGLTEQFEAIDAKIIDESEIHKVIELQIQEKVSVLEDRLQNIEQVTVGGVRYCGAVESYDLLPETAQIGDLYEVYEDNSEWCWNGEKWFEYGRTSDIPDTYATKDEVRSIARLVEYEISNKPNGTLVNYYESEVRVMCPVGTAFSHQQPGENGDANNYYIGFRAYAPNNDVVAFKEDLAEIISDTTMYTFENNEFAGIDEFGRKYSIVWLPVAAYSESSDSWTYYGASSTPDKFIGWNYSVEWYDAAGVKVAADTIRINLANEECFLSSTPSYVASLKSQIAELEEAYAWGDM